MRIATTALGLGCVLAMAGCAADRSQPPTARIPDGRAAAAGVDAGAAAAPIPPESAATEGAVLDRRVAAAEQSVRRSEAARARRAIARVRSGADARIARGDTAAARGTTLALAAALGLGNVTVTVSDGGRKLAVAVPASGACAAPVSGPRSLADGLLKALPFVRSVDVSVGGIALADYADRHCAFAQLPGATTVTAATGSGTTETQPFHVGRGRWIVDYGSSGTFVQVLVLRDAELLVGSAQRSSATTGQIAFSGPGTYTLRIAGDGPWAVQVRRG